MLKRLCTESLDRCYSGIAAEIGVKNMPPACFLNTPTRADVRALLLRGKRRERAGEIVQKGEIQEAGGKILKPV